METQYTAKDVLQMAVQAKARGVDLYLTLARNSENYHVGKLFTELAKDEQRHKMDIERKIKELSTEAREEAYPGEKALYLKALVDSNVFVCTEAQEKALETTISEEDAIQAGITFEKDFMLFLHDMKNQVSKETGELVDTLLEEEIKHLGEFFHLKERIQK